MKHIKVPDVPAPPGVCWKQCLPTKANPAPANVMERCTYPVSHVGPHQWEQSTKQAIR